MGDFSLHLVLPVACLAAFGLLTMILSALSRGDSRGPAFVTLVGLLMTGVILVVQWREWTIVVLVFHDSGKIERQPDSE